MTTRRTFLKVAATGLVGRAAVSTGNAGGEATAPQSATTVASDRQYWVNVLEHIARPVLANLAAGTLRKKMPVETSGKGREQFTHLEAVGRLLCGIGPWLVVETKDAREGALQQQFRELAQRGLDRATDLASADFLNFSEGGQALVDTAFLAQGIVRGKAALWSPLEPRVKQQVIAALKASRKIEAPAKNNWVMFAALVEAALLELGETPVPERLGVELQRMVNWYVGDGEYGDGPAFHWDYYNAFVIQPMLVDTMGVMAGHDARFGSAREVVLRRARRFAEIEERLIAPDGSFPSIGRSTTYRVGAFQTLGQMALLRNLPEHLPAAQVRCALTAVMRRMMSAAGTFDESGWLRVGFCGHQPALGEGYISTGSLYLCAAGLLPLGLGEGDAFWRDPPRRWTSQALWGGENLPADHALAEGPALEIPR